jgi:hypothetical protein
MVRWYAGRLHSSVDKLIDVTNSHTTVIAVEQKRNDDQDKRLDDHHGDIQSIKEKIWQVTYKRA